MRRAFCILAAWIAHLSWSTISISASSGVLPTFFGAVGSLDVPREAVPVYRFWSPIRGCHFYTIDEVERDKLLSLYSHAWTYEGVAFRVFPSAAADGLMPVHRFWSDRLGSHFYTLDEAEKDGLIGNYSHVWTYEGVAFYAYPPGDEPEGVLAVYRFWSGSLGAHFYSTKDPERFKLVSIYSHIWTDEGVVWYAYPPTDPPVIAFSKGPYVPWVTSDSATIMWETDAPADTAVCYGTVTVQDFTASNAGMTTLHRVVLAGLEPGAVYAYRASSGGTSRLGAFMTAPRPEQPFRFTVYGDSRSDPDAHRQVTAGVAGREPDIVFHTGDLVGNGRDITGWGTEFFEPAGGLMRMAPLVSVAGNHEYYGTGPPWFLYYFNRPLGAGWFAMTYGNARFIGLDTNAAYSPGSPQYDWLVQELQSTACRSATWRIIIFHHPPFTFTIGHSDNLTVQRQLVPLFEQGGVNLVFNGHSHVYERYLHHGIYYIVTGGGGAPLSVPLIDLVSPIRQFGRSTHHYCAGDVDPSAGTLTVGAVDVNGQAFDAITLRK